MMYKKGKQIQNILIFIIVKYRLYLSECKTMSPFNNNALQHGQYSATN